MKTTYLIFKNEKGLFSGKSLTYNYVDAFYCAKQWDFFGVDKAEDAAAFVFSRFKVFYDEVRLVDKDTNKTIKTFYRQ